MLWPLPPPFKLQTSLKNLGLVFGLAPTVGYIGWMTRLFRTLHV
jgi:hypothetical protein